MINLNNAQLSHLSASIGRLKKLKILSLNGNNLTTLPNTLSFCTSLEELNLESNSFSILPGVILWLDSLNTLRRYGNYRLHVGAADLATRARREGYITVITEQVRDEIEREVVPLKLLAVQSIMISKIDYWSSVNLAPAVCKILDMCQSEYKICDHCFAAIPHHRPGIMYTV